MRQIMSNTQKSDFLSRVVARCWIQRHLCFHGSHSKSASYSLQQRNKLESKSRSLFVTFICTRMHMHAHRQGDNELPTPAAASMPVRWFTVHQEMGRCSCKFWARAGAWFVSWTSRTKMFRSTFFLFRRKLQKSQAVLAETSFTSEPTSKVKDEHCGISVMHIMTEGSEHYWRLGNARWRSLTMCTANGPSWSSLYVDFQAFITSPTLRCRYFRVIRWSVCLSASHESQSHSWDLS